MAPSRPDDESTSTKLDARLMALTRLPSPVVGDMLARDEPRRLRGKGRLALQVLHGVRAERDQVVSSVLIRFRGSPARLTEAGARVGSVIGDVATADVTLDALRALERDPEVDFIELARPLFPLLDESVEEIGAAALHRSASPIRGKGVVVGVIDIGGIDIHHPDFCAERSGATRIEHLWDQTGRSTPRPGAGGRCPEPWGYGLEYTADEIDRDAAGAAPYRVVDARPSDDHGTHVAGIAAGNGRASGGKYVGVAPDAAIIFVNLRNDASGDLGSTLTLCDALKYVFARANGRPCVVNVSLGTRGGPRDGTSNAERVIDQLVATPGCAVVVAAGNDGHRRRSAHGILPREGALTLELAVPVDTDVADAIEVWVPGSERLGATVITPRGASLGPVAPGEHTSFVVERTRVTVSSTRDAARGGDNSVTVLIQPDERMAIEPGRWKLVLTREGAPGDAESAYHATLTGASEIVWVEPSVVSTLTSPGTAEGAITVANYLYRGGGGLSHTSSRGPTRDGRRKPDIAAPGSGVCSARRGPTAAERDVTRGGPENPYYGQTTEDEGPPSHDEAASAMRGPATTPAKDPHYMPLTGTSMAAPHVAGLIALIYERQGPIGIDALKALLIEHADRSGCAPGWDPGWGWGKLRA